MTQYLLDTNVLIAIMRGHATVKQRTRTIDPDSRRTSSLVIFKLWYGVSRSAALAKNTERMRQALTGTEVLAFNQGDAEAAGAVRATLQRAKQPIGPYDTLITGQALARGLTLVTASEREFRRVKGLRVENWERAAI